MQKHLTTSETVTSLDSISKAVVKGMSEHRTVSVFLGRDNLSIPLGVAEELAAAIVRAAKVLKEHQG